jgi:hypothetical protein
MVAAFNAAREREQEYGEIITGCGDVAAGIAPGSGPVNRHDVALRRLEPARCHIVPVGLELPGDSLARSRT